MGYNAALAFVVLKPARFAGIFSGLSGSISLAQALTLSLVLGFCWPVTLMAQSGTGRIEGIVRQAGGEPISHAIVTVTGQGTRAEMSDAGGRYVVSGLAAGNYTISVERPGFAPARQAGVRVGPNLVAEVVFTLKPAPNETVVVTASRIEADLQSAPAALSVVGAGQIETAPATNFGDLLRAVPGLNVVQTSAREINLASRQASPNLTNSQIALVDGRTIFADFYDVVFWDLIPVNTNDIKQIEVVRGPIAAVWGPNAATGAVNIITKTPREATGLSFALSGGSFGRDAGRDAGSANGGFGAANLTFSHAVNRTWAYRISTGYAFSDPFARPGGRVPVARSPVDPSVVVGGGSFADVDYANPGTRQPKFNFRLDQERGSAGRVTYEGGFAGTQGIIQTPIGPFRIESGGRLSYGRLDYVKDRGRVSFFANVFDGKAPGLLTRAADGSPLRINFHTGTYDVSAGHTRLLAGRHLLNYGGNLRHSSFDISLTPNAKDRTEVGGYFEDEILLGKLRVPLGFRLDKFSNLSEALFSPRAAVVFRPFESHSLRFSFNRAHRSPSAIDNFVDVSLIGGYFPLGLVNPAFGSQLFPIVTRSYGNAELKSEVLTGWEMGYAGTLPSRGKLSLAFYLNDSDRIISNLQSAAALIASGAQPFYTSQNPPPGWPLPPPVLDLLALQGIRFPSSVKTLNYGKVRNRGFEAALDQPLSRTLFAFANYSFQATPQTRSPQTDPFRYPAGSLPVPPRDRFNAGLNLNSKRYLGSLSLNYAGKAFWTDTRDLTYYGFTDPYRMVNCSFGVRWSEGKVVTSFKAVNLMNHDIQQHVFGDILKRRVFGEILFGF